jgi:hypothetical protein
VVQSCAVILTQRFGGSWAAAGAAAVSLFSLFDVLLAVHLFSLSALISFLAVQFFLIFLFICVCGLFHVGVDVHLFGVHNVA